MKIIITENIFNIQTKKTIKECILTRNKNIFTRQLYQLDDTPKRNNHIDTINTNNLTLNKKEIDKLIYKHMNQELPGFINPNINYHD